MVQSFSVGRHRITKDNLEQELEILYKLASEYDYEEIFEDWYN